MNIDNTSIEVTQADWYASSPLFTSLSYGSRGLHCSSTLRLGRPRSETKAGCTVLSIYLLESCFNQEYHCLRDFRGFEIQNSTEGCLLSSLISWTNRYHPYFSQWASWYNIQDSKRGVMISSTCSVLVVWGRKCIGWAIYWTCLGTDNYPSLSP